MGSATTSLRETAQSIFADLGYTVSPAGGELRAERKWRVVRVTPVAEPGDPPEDGDMRCFVTPADRIDDLEADLEATDPDYEWAIIGVETDDSGFEDPDAAVEEYVVAGPSG